MRIDIRLHGGAPGEALRRYAERRLRLALGSAGGRPGRLVVQLLDQLDAAASPRPVCTVRVLLPGQAPLAIEECADDLRLAIDRAASRTRRSVMRGLSTRGGSTARAQRPERP